MNEASNISSHGYQPLRELGHNSLGGRVTYLAQNCQTREKVVIKQFQFATGNSTWSEYDSYQQEIKVLKSLDYPGIPRYLDSFQTPDGFCMVQEYIDAPSAATRRSWTPEQIKAIALSTLKILVYLQSRHPSIIHRDIKPENILIDDNLNVYLVDFGFARLGGGDIAASSVIKGTMGFMPPEQLFNRRLTNASDLYALGATLICLLTGIKSADIGSLIDADYRVHFRHLIPPQKRGWLNWLEKMVEPKVGDRFANASEALAVLKPLNVSRLPRVRLEHQKLTLTAEEWGEKVSQTIQITNPVPDTVLSGRWEVAPHPSDPPHTPYDHPYISFTPPKFEVNQITCTVTVDTRQLLMGETYQRQILLRTNSDPEVCPVDVEIKTQENLGFFDHIKEFSSSRFLAILLSAIFGFVSVEALTRIENISVRDICLASFLFIFFMAIFVNEKLGFSEKYPIFDRLPPDYTGIMKSVYTLFCGIFGGITFGLLFVVFLMQLYESYSLSFLYFILGMTLGMRVAISGMQKFFLVVGIIIYFLIGSLLFLLDFIDQGTQFPEYSIRFLVLLAIFHGTFYCFYWLLRAMIRMSLCRRNKIVKNPNLFALMTVIYFVSIGAFLRLIFSIITHFRRLPSDPRTRTQPSRGSRHLSCPRN
ncbi:MAG: protein kinase domain-containing protein [Limnospira sp.]